MHKGDAAPEQPKPVPAAQTKSARPLEIVPSTKPSLKPEAPPEGGESELTPNIDPA
jgi:hypothetical protein